MKRKLQLNQLTIDEKLIELRPINAHVVSQYRQAYRAGKDLGVIEVDAESNRIVSGNHRVTAMLEEFGPDYKITVEATKFADEAAVLRRFAEANSAHGLLMTMSSKRAIAAAMIDEGISSNEVANIFGVSVKRVEDWGAFTVQVRGVGRRFVKRGPDIIGKTITKPQYEAHHKADVGMSAYTQAEQLTRWLNNGWIDLKEERTVRALRELYEALGPVVEGMKLDAA